MIKKTLFKKTQLVHTILFFVEMQNYIAHLNTTWKTICDCKYITGTHGDETNQKDFISLLNNSLPMNQTQTGAVECIRAMYKTNPDGVAELANGDLIGLNLLLPSSQIHQLLKMESQHKIVYNAESECYGLIVEDDGFVVCRRKPQKNVGYKYNAARGRGATAHGRGAVSQGSGATAHGRGTIARGRGAVARGSSNSYNRGGGRGATHRGGNSYHRGGRGAKAQNNGAVLYNRYQPPTKNTIPVDTDEYLAVLQSMTDNTAEPMSDEDFNKIGKDVSWADIP